MTAISDDRLHSSLQQRSLGWGWVVLSIAAFEIAVIAVAQLSATLGALGLALVTVVQIVAAARVDGRTGKVLLIASAVSIAAAAALGGSVWLRKDIQHIDERGILKRGGPLGWTLDPGTSQVTRLVNGRTIYSQTYTIGPDGRRQTISAASGPAVAFFGDSFTFGDGVADADTLPQAFADATNRQFRVLNLGVDAYSPAQVLREIELGLSDQSLKPAKALFMLTVDWHAARVACAHESMVDAPRYTSENGVVRLAGTCEAPPPPTLLGRMLMKTPLGKLFVGLRHASDAEIQTYIDVIVAADRAARSRYGVPLRVLYLRNASYLMFNHFSDDKIIAQLRERNVPVYDLTLPEEGHGDYVIPLDGHPSALAQRSHARLLVSTLARTEPDLLGLSVSAAP